MAALKRYISKRLRYTETVESSCAASCAALLSLLDERERRTLEKEYTHAHIGLVTLELAEFYALRSADQELLGPSVMDTLEFEAMRQLPEIFPEAVLLCLERVDFSTVLLVFRITRDAVAFASAAQLFRIQIRERLDAALLRSVRGVGEVRAGFAHLPPRDQGPLPQAFFRAYCHARRQASRPGELKNLPLYDEFRSILERGGVSTLYQPVYDFRTGQVLGWEAFSRGPADSVLERPQALFKLAEELDAAFELEALCREAALRNLGPIRPGQKLFLNNLSSELSSPGFSPEHLLALVEPHGLQPGDVVLEFAERQGFHDMTMFHQALQQFRRKGFHVAIDDVGSGDSSLRAITQIRPDYIKIDIGLIGGVDSNPFHRCMVETLVHLAGKLDAHVIAVGVERDTELSSLVSMGVAGGQGRLLGEPAPERSSESVSIPLKSNFFSLRASSQYGFPIKDLAKPAYTASPRTTVREIKEMLADTPPQTSVVVTQGPKPIGLLMQYNTDRHLSTQFGMSLYYHREVERIMDTAPLVVEGSTAVEETARLAMSRDSEKVYDDIIVVEEEALVGLVSVQGMLDQLALMQVELAKGANPLSGLPGNVVIEREIERRAKLGEPTAVTYVDLDHFKVYNDVYGFERGDRILLLTAEVLNRAVERAGDSADFVGHIGGDDFVLLLAPEHARAVCDEATALFRKEVPRMYTQDDVERGFIVGKGRDGQVGRYPLTSLSIAVVDCDFTGAFSMAKLSARMADVKKRAKEIVGDAIVREPF